MYYPMRVVRDRKYKLIWNIAHPLPYPFASDLWAAATWQAQWARSAKTPAYGTKTVGEYIQRPEFELYDMENDPDEAHNLAHETGHAETLDTYKAKLRDVPEGHRRPLDRSSGSMSRPRESPAHR